MTATRTIALVSIGLALIVGCTKKDAPAASAEQNLPQVEQGEEPDQEYRQEPAHDEPEDELAEPADEPEAEEPGVAEDEAAEPPDVAEPTEEPAEEPEGEDDEAEEDLEEPEGAEEG